MKKITFLIPCLNEARTITKVIRQANETGRKAFPRNFEILVADNGSTDGSLTKIRKQKLARIVHVPVRGYGAALHWGIMKAKTQYVLYADADLSYDFREAPRFLLYMQKADLILGSRLKGKILAGAMPYLHRHLGTPVLTFFIRTLYNLPVSDCNSGMRMIRRSFYKKLHMHNSGMEWASELLIKTALHEGRYVEVPITLRRDQRHRPPHLLSWVDGWRHLKAIVLLKPNFLFSVVLAFITLGFVTPRLSFFFFLASYGLLLSTLAAKLLQFAIDETDSWTVRTLQRLPIVSGVIILNILAMVGLFFLNTVLPDFWKMISAVAVVMLDVWVFHIETIKTHVMYRLPAHLD